jgi:sigma-B regulation protein RsbU (phosphoserine phosphatase)
MAPGDYLVCYTDGLTEAFSPENEIFGEDRLEAALLGRGRYLGAGEPGGEPGPGESPAASRQALGAENVLDAIEETLEAFVRDEPRHDDLTLMVLRRDPEAGPASM